MVQNKPLCVCPVVHRLKRPGLPLHLPDRQAQLLSCRRWQPLDFPASSTRFSRKPFSINQLVIVVAFSRFLAGIMDPVRDPICKLGNSKCFL